MLFWIWNAPSRASMYLEVSEAAFTKFPASRLLLPEVDEADVVAAEAVETEADAALASELMSDASPRFEVLPMYIFIPR